MFGSTTSNSRPGSGYGRVLGANPNVTQAVNAGFQVTPWQSTGGGRGHYGGGIMGGRRISSAGVAGGIPTSARGRYERAVQGFGPINSQDDADAAMAAGAESAMTPAWQQSSQDWQQNAFKPRYGGLLPQRPVVPTTQPNPMVAPTQGNLLPSPQIGTTGNAPLTGTLTGMNSGMFPRPIGMFGRGTGGRPAPPGQPIITGDPQRSGKPNPEIVIPAPEGTHVIPIKDLPKYAYGTSLPPLAIDEIAPKVTPSFKNGEIKLDAHGNPWRYDASLGHGVPENPYLGDPNRPMPISTFEATPAERYNDLANRLSALRQAGMAQGRVDIAALKAEQNALAPKSDLQPIGFNHGGIEYAGKYGKAVLGAKPMELTGQIAPSAIPQMASAPTIIRLPDDRPSTVESRRRAWGMRSKVPVMTFAKATSRGKEAAIRRAADLATNAQTAIDLGLVQPWRDLKTNAATAWDMLTQ